MSIAISEPLQDVSDVVLRQMNSKSLKSGLKKYNPAVSKPYNVVTKKRTNRSKSPSKAAQNAANVDSDNDGDFGDLPRDVQVCLRDLTNGSSIKMSLIKMQIVKSDQNTATFNRIKACLKQADIDEAERLLESLEDSNMASLEEMQSELSDGINILQTVSTLSSLLKQ